MNTAPTIKFTDVGPKVGVTTARLLLQHAIVTEEQKRSGEHPDLVRKRAINDQTGASIHVLPQVPAEDESAGTTTPLDRHGIE